MQGEEGVGIEPQSAHRRMTGSALAMELQFRAAPDVAFGVFGADQAPLGGGLGEEGVGAEL